MYAEHCQKCHGDAATGDLALPGTPVHSPEGHTWHHPDGQLAEIILGQTGGTNRTMPSFEGILSQDDVAAILAYLKTNWPPDQQTYQADISRQWTELRRQRP
jgi:mono/diheme cytochrome c family protein